MNNYEYVTNILDKFLLKGAYIKTAGSEENSIEYVMKSSIKTLELKFLDDDHGCFELWITTTDGESLVILLGHYELDENFNLIEWGGALPDVETKWFNKDVGFEVDRGITLIKK